MKTYKELMTCLFDNEILYHVDHPNRQIHYNEKLEICLDEDGYRVLTDYLVPAQWQSLTSKEEK